MSIVQFMTTVLYFGLIIHFVSGMIVGSKMKNLLLFNVVL